MPKPYRALFVIVAMLLVVSLCMTFALAAEAPARKLPPNCFQWQEALAKAKARFGEVPAYIGTAGGLVFTVTVNPETGSWSMWAQPNPDVMCVILSGRGWEAAPDSIAHPPPPAPQMFRVPDGKGGVMYILPADAPNIRHPPSY